MDVVGDRNPRRSKPETQSKFIGIWAVDSALEVQVVTLVSCKPMGDVELYSGKRPTKRVIATQGTLVEEFESIL
jgi:hypothetical protein